MQTNYALLADAQTFYAKNGYSYIDVPWWVTRAIAESTLPPGKDTSNDYYLPLNNKVLVASGEQSFLYLAHKGQLPKGKYQTITPCFRFEPHDQTNRKHFMKQELTNLSPKDPEEALVQIVRHAVSFYQQYRKAPSFRAGI